MDAACPDVAALEGMLRLMKLQQLAAAGDAVARAELKALLERSGA